MTLEISYGTGSVASTEGTSTSIIGAYTGTTSNSYTFNYTRLGTTADISPVLTANLIANYDVKKYITIRLRDSADNVMTT